MRRWSRLLLAAALGVGCSVLAPRPDPSRFFVLSPLADTSGAARGSWPPGVSVGVGPVGMPPYLQRPEIATRIAENRVTFSEVARWAEPLDASIARVLGENLVKLLGTERVFVYPWFDGRRPDYVAQVDVLRFEPVAGRGAEIAARWRVRDGRSGAVLEERESTAAEPIEAAGADAQVAALSRALADLSHDLATALQRVAASRPPGAAQPGGG